MKKIMLLAVVTIAMLFAFATVTTFAVEVKEEATAPVKVEDIQKQIAEKKAALQKETDPAKKAALEKEIKELEAKLPKKAN